jgi:glycosyltransferase involved in cell wall biosynthesis
MNPAGVNVFGPVGVASGLGSAVRGHLRAMWDAGLRTRVFPFIITSAQGIVPFSLPDEETLFDISIVYVNAEGTDFAFERFGEDLARSRYRIGVWVWELAAANPAHVRFAARYDEIWVPSSFNQRAFSAAMKTPVHRVPYVVDSPPERQTDLRQRLGIPNGAFVFLYMFDAFSFVQRKNPHALLRAFAREFEDDEAVLVLKVAYSAEANPEFAAELEAAERSIPNLRVIREVLPEDELHSLFASADCYVSPHRSEGFGLTLAEAMALGKPVVTTDYGSTRDFASEDTAFPVKFRLVEIEQDLGPYFSGAVWADPDEADLARQMRLVRENPREARRRALAGRSFVQNAYSLPAIGRSIRDRVEAAGKRFA